VKTILSDAGGQGTVTLKSSAGGTTVLGSQALTSTGLNKWTDGYNYTWTSYATTIPASGGYNFTNTVTPWVGSMQVTPVSGPGPTVDLADFNLQLAEAPGSTGFLGIQLPTSLQLSARAVIGANNSLLSL
jgi:hypothetical protein